MNTFKSVPFVQYSEITPRPSDESQIANLKEIATNPYLLSYTTPMNALKYLVRGLISISILDVWMPFVRLLI